MINRHWHEYPCFRYMYPVLYYGIASLIMSCCSLLPFAAAALLNSTLLKIVFVVMIVTSFTLLCVGIYRDKTLPPCRRIYYDVREVLFRPSYGNPLKLHSGDILPHIAVTKLSSRTYRVRITSRSVRIEKLKQIGDVISYALVGDELAGYAVTDIREDISGNYVDFILQDVAYLHSQQDVYESFNDFIDAQEGNCHDSDDENPQ